MSLEDITTFLSSIKTGGSGGDAQVCRFSRPHKEVIAERKYPSSTAVEFDLYALPGLPPDKSQVMETEFFKPIDDAASKALLFLESGAQNDAWSPQQRTAWSRFIMAQLMRTPEDVSRIKSLFAKQWRELDPQKLADRLGWSIERVREERLESSPEEMERGALNLLRSAIDHRNVIGVINNMFWSTVELSPHRSHTLMTSDRPVWQSDPLGVSDAMLLMPIGPTRLFLARNSKIQLAAEPELVKAVNNIVVSHAKRFVIADDDSQRRFVKNRMGTKPFPSTIDLLARHWEREAR